MDRLVHRYFLIVLVRIFGGTIFYAGGATRTFVLKDIPWLLSQGYLETSYLPLHALDFGVGEDLYIWMPADLDQFGRENSHGTVVGGKRLIELGHMAANARRFLHQVNLKTRSSEIKRGLNATDSSTDNQYVSKIPVGETVTNP
jgi:hypothetical protein